jgi:mycothiol synthase
MSSIDTTEAAALPAGYRAQAATPDDAHLAAQLRTTYQAEEGDPGVITAEEQLNDWQGMNLAEDTVLVFAPDGRLAAHAEIWHRRYLQVSVYGGVHPQHRRWRLGTFLVRWGAAWARDHMDQAPADAQITVQHYINMRNEQACALVETLGYAYEHTVNRMRIVMEEPPPVPERIEGVRIRTFASGRDERVTYETVEDTFRDMRGRAQGSFETWLSWTENERHDPGLWYLAEDEHSGAIVGVCLARLFAGSCGWIRAVGVRRAWRRHGLGLTLLHAAFGEFYRRGERMVELCVDAGSPTGAPHLYTRAGMQVVQRISLYRKQLRPGKDYSTLPETAGAESAESA